MKNISLEVLDEYAKRISNKQANKLYEAKNGKPYQKALYEKDNSHIIYLNEYTILDETGKCCSEFTYMLNEKYQDVMKSIFYKIDEDALIMKTNDKGLYEKLVNILAKNGISEKIYNKNL